MNSSRLKSSRVAVLLLGGVSVVVIVMYLHLASEVAQLHTSMYPGAAMSYQQQVTQFGGAGGALDLNSLVVIYNRVPKTGSTSFIGLAYDLCARNKFNVIHLNTTKNTPTLSLTDQMRFVYNVSNWLEKKPGIYHGHLAYLDFSRFGVSRQPIYINLIRKPLDRLVSYYYFVRYGDDLRPNHIRRRMGDKMVRSCVCVCREDQGCVDSMERTGKSFTDNVSHHYHCCFLSYCSCICAYFFLCYTPFSLVIMPASAMFYNATHNIEISTTQTLDECVVMEHPDCSTTHLWIQVPFFCGHHAECWVPGSNWALEQAKHNLIHKYFLVGVTEEMGDFVAMLDYSLPRIFMGAYDLYLSGLKSHLRKTVKKVLPSQETIAKLQNTKVWRLENEFYNFALDHFHFLRKKTLVEAEEGGRQVDRGQKFAYEKIKPKRS